ncbi:diversity-generating retroelement protein Avd [bacterium]|nr:diversity-generating retroelement protein Avd [bacterium]
MDRSESFPKSVRFTLSSRLVNLSLDMIELIVEAIYSSPGNRHAIINRMNLKLEQLRVLIRIAMDRKYLSFRQYEFIAGEINETGKMLGGWKKHETSKRTV